MIIPAAHLIRSATPHDDYTLLRLSVLDSKPVVRPPALIGEIGGTPAAAISLADGRIVADPFLPSATLNAQLRLAAQGRHDSPPRRGSHRRRVAFALTAAMALLALVPLIT
jgi:hypothetical protein